LFSGENLFSIPSSAAVHDFGEKTAKPSNPLESVNKKTVSSSHKSCCSHINMKRKQNEPVDISSSDDENNRVSEEIIPSNSGQHSVDTTSSKCHVTTMKSPVITKMAKRLCPQKIVVNTVKEAFKEFVTLIPTEKTIPKCTSPPQSPTIFSLSRSDVELITQICQTLRHNKTTSSIITFFMDDNTQIPQSHIAIKINKNSFKQDSINSLPHHKQLLYELFLSFRSYNDYRYPVKAFVNWCLERHIDFMITIPESHHPKVSFLLDEPTLIHTTRPFPMVAFSSSNG
jgi:hypothetical protein